MAVHRVIEGLVPQCRERLERAVIDGSLLPEHAAKLELDLSDRCSRERWVDDVVSRLYDLCRRCTSSACRQLSRTVGGRLVADRLGIDLEDRGDVEHWSGQLAFVLFEKLLSSGQLPSYSYIRKRIDWKIASIRQAGGFRKALGVTHLAEEVGIPDHTGTDLSPWELEELHRDIAVTCVDAVVALLQSSREARWERALMKCLARVVWVVESSGLDRGGFRGHLIESLERRADQFPPEAPDRFREMVRGLIAEGRVRCVLRDAGVEPANRIWTEFLNKFGELYHREAIRWS